MNPVIYSAFADEVGQIKLAFGGTVARGAQALKKQAPIQQLARRFAQRPTGPTLKTPAWVQKMGPIKTSGVQLTPIAKLLGKAPVPARQVGKELKGFRSVLKQQRPQMGQTKIDWGRFARQ